MFLAKKAEALTAASPLPQVEITPTTAPGKRGPVGTAPRTNYSRVNTGTPPVPDAGSQIQKSMAPMGGEMPQKFAGSEVPMGQIAVRPTVNEMIKAAMNGAMGRVDINLEAQRQANLLAEEKTASSEEEKEDEKEETSTEEANKIASVLDYIADEYEKEASTPVTHNMGPGKGPNHLGVMESYSGPQLSDNLGQKKYDQPPIHPGLQDGNQMPNTMNSPAEYHKHQQTALPGPTGRGHGPSHTNTEGRKHAAEIRKVAFSLTGAGHEFDAEKYKAHRDAAGKTREARSAYKDKKPGLANATTGLEILTALGAAASATPSIIGGGTGALSNLGDTLSERHYDYAAKKHEAGRNAYNPFGGLLTPTARERSKHATAIRQAVKQAEDRLNPARISAGHAAPHTGLVSGETGGVPQPSGSTALISSNEAARNFTKREAKAVPRQDLRSYVDDPPLSRTTDKTLDVAFNHGKETHKFASAVASTARAAQAKALLSKFAEDAEEKKKARTA